MLLFTIFSIDNVKADGTCVGDGCTTGEEGQDYNAIDKDGLGSGHGSCPNGLCAYNNGNENLNTSLYEISHFSFPLFFTGRFLKCNAIRKETKEAITKPIMASIYPPPKRITGRATHNNIKTRVITL